jgi:HD superfamily phosphohydrolase
VRSLHSWLERTELREEFYLGLLFHDIGHGPLSHVLERNSSFIEAFKAAGFKEEDARHEHRGAILIRGKGPLVDTWREMSARRYGREPRILADVVAQLEQSERVCIPSILYLITSDKSFLKECAHEHRESIGVLHELVSGLLDLDRLDHYARDSYFSGLRQVSINVRGFLNSLCLAYSDSDPSSISLSLTGDGASHAASLLFGKRQILATMFRNPRTISLHAMSNWALGAFLCDLPAKERSTKALEISMMDDDQFFEMIGGALNTGCRYISQRIRMAQPYGYVGKWVNRSSEPEETLKGRLRSLSDALAQDHSPCAILHYDDGFWQAGRTLESRDWLDSGCLMLDDTKQCITDHPDYADSFSHLQRADKMKYVWAFSRDREKIKELRGDIGDIMGYSSQG